MRRSLIFDPSTVGPLYAWYSARNVAIAPNPTGGQSRVTRCYDLSGGGKHGTLSSTYQPLWTPSDPLMNGRPSILNDQASGAGTGGGFNTPFTYAVPLTVYWAGYSTFSASQGPDMFSLNGGSGRMFFGGGNNGQLRINGTPNAIAFTVSGTFTKVSILCFTIDVNGGTANAYWNSANTVIGTVSPTISLSGSPTLLNAQGTNNNSGAFGDYLFCSGLHNLAQRQQMISWLGYEYRVTVTLN